jgi:DNA invertase Pin-like site-specific DNA recombinase
MNATAYGYARVSTAKQDMSIEAQKQQVEGYYKWKLKTLGIEWGGFFSDAAVSGNKPFRKRPAGAALWDRLGPGDHVIVSKQDRAFRNTADHFNCLDSWRARGIKVHVLDIGVDTTTPVGELLMGILAQVAQFERSRLIERMKIVNAVKRQLGMATSNQQPLGFRGVRRDDGHVYQEWYEPEVLLMRRAYVEYERMKFTCDQIAERFNREGVKRPRKNRRNGGKIKWCRQTVHLLIGRYRKLLLRPDLPEYGKLGGSSSTPKDATTPSSATPPPAAE